MTLGDDTNGDAGTKAHYGRVDDQRMSADDMDAKRKENIAYEYLCHLEEAKVWIEACINETLPPTTVLEEGLRNGVFLGKLGHFMSPEIVPMKKIYDKDQSRYEARGLHFRHTDNINHWLKALEDVGMPKIFWPETTDIYDRKNMPKVIYCIHALSLYLFKLGKAPQIQDLYGKIKFTDEEISAMRKELEKYGIQMPAFSKIGGILANEMPVDEAALHAAVIAINDAIDKGVAEDTVVALQLPAAHLINIQPDLANQYQIYLAQAKDSKAEIVRNKSLDPDSSYIPDVYDELLTQAELQGNLNMLNSQQALLQINKAVKQNDSPMLLVALRSPYLKLRDIKDDFSDAYLSQLKEVKDSKKNNNNEDLFTKEEVQAAVNAANLSADEAYQKQQLVKIVNKALDEGDTNACYHALGDPKMYAPKVFSFAAGLYLEELRSMKSEKQSSLDYDEIISGIRVLSAIAKVNEAMDANNSDLTVEALLNPDTHISGIDYNCKDKYLQKFNQARRSKSGGACDLLSYFDIQQCINETNQQVTTENDRISAVGKINEVLEYGNPAETLVALQSPAAHLPELDPRQAVHYHNLLTQMKHVKSEQSGDPTCSLWYEEILDATRHANKHTVDGNTMSVCVAAVNIAVESADSQTLITCLQNDDMYLHSVTPQCAEMYLSKLIDFKQRKSQAGDNGSGWMMNRLREGHKFYFNVNNMDWSWERFEGMKKDYGLLTRDEIQTCVSSITTAYDRQLLFKANERFVIVVQAHVRGHLARKSVNQRRAFINTQLPAVLKLQAWWRMVRIRRGYVERMSFLNSQKHAAVMVQAGVRGFLVRKRFQGRMEYFKMNEWAVIKIQSFMRTNLAKKDYRMLMRGDNPPLSVVRRFVHLMDIGDLDYTEEIDLEKLRQQVVTEIRTNQQLEIDLNQMDIKIGLLVKNRITLQDVVSQHKTLKKYKDDSSSNLNKQGLKSLSKQSRERLEAYQHLFYLLQTNPIYLAKLIFEMPQSRTTKFMESVVLTLYNYASNQREEFLLLKLFQTALREEIRSKMDKMSDIVTGNPLVVKMIVSFNRNARGQGSLRQLLNPLVTSVIESRNLQINTNPTEVYKQWVNQMETQTGRASGLPYEVTPEQALQHQEVRDLIQLSVGKLQEATEKFLQAILSGVELIPYGMRYMAKVMQDALKAQFPSAPEKDILKIIGNLIYYRYINSAIVAPDAFDIIDVGANKGLTNDQRRNLGSIAKILQFAASNKGFGGDSNHLSCLNRYIMDAHNRFKKYFRLVCNVEEPEMRFNMDQYTDVTRVTKPVIYISIAEIIDTHKLLLDHQDVVAPDPADPIHEIMDDLSDVPDVDSLIGDGVSDLAANRSHLAKTEISLTLSNKFDVLDEEQSNIKDIMIRTKRMVIDVIRCQSNGDNLVQILHRPVARAEEHAHQMLIKKRERVDQKAMNKKAKLVRQQSMIGDTRIPLEQMKKKIQGNLQILEQAGLVSSQNYYQELINSIVEDLRKQRLYRQGRKQEMVRLRSTIKSLSGKRSFFEEQIDYYNQYVKTCLDNLSTKKTGKRSSIFGGRSGDAPKRVKGSIKYSAARLHEKGIILEIEGLPQNQFKNVLFEITATENVGSFDVSAKFMGVSMEKVELIFQDLLQLQYEGVAVMQMFDKAKVNVNLLIFLLNKKFYGK